MANSCFVFLFLFYSPVFTIAGEVQIIVPPAQISTSRTNIQIVGQTDSPFAVASLNGRLLDPVKTSDSIFHILVWLPYGLNKVEIFPLISQTAAPDSMNSQIVEILCGPKISRIYKKIFEPYRFHDSENKVSCLGCHEPAVAVDEFAQEFVEDADWCYSCHSLVRKQYTNHVVSDQKLCTNCHWMSSDLAWQKVKNFSGENPCFLCHQEKMISFAKEFIHGPVAGGVCIICHDPHGSEFGKTLRSPVPVLCLFCHTEVEKNVERVQHAPFLKGKCVACHDPHSTDFPWLLKRGSRELCLECHPEVKKKEYHRHPFNSKPSSTLSAELKLDDQGFLECMTCHEPHSSSADYLLHASEGHACLGCHPEYQ